MPKKALPPVKPPTAKERVDLLINIKRIKFCNEWLRNGQNGRAAYKHAYGADLSDSVADANASRMLADARVKEYIDNKVKLLEEIATVDLSWTFKKRMEIVGMSMQAVPVIDKYGKPTGEFQYDSGGANRALEAIEKNYLGIVDKSEITHTIANVSEEDKKILADYAARKNPTKV